MGSLLHLIGLQELKRRFRKKGRVTGPALVCSLAIQEFADDERRLLLQLARKSILEAVTNGKTPQIEGLPGRCCEKRACFVTLSRSGALRGCIGTLSARAPLYRAILENACGAALRDPRFPPVTAAEIEDLKIEISVLSEPQLLIYGSEEELLSKLSPSEHGVLLQIEGRLATFLPKVWRQIPGKVDFLDQLSRKAGYGPGAWRGKDASISVYHVESFEESGSSFLNN
jgi:AmmeMemoRadiSam system protein A